MRLVHALPVNHAHHCDDPLREDTNVAQLRITPDSSSIGKVTPTQVTPKNGGAPVPTWTCEIGFDVVFVVSEDADVDDVNPVPSGGGANGGTTGGDEPPPEE